MGVQKNISCGGKTTEQDLFSSNTIVSRLFGLEKVQHKEGNESFLFHLNIKVGKFR